MARFSGGSGSGSGAPGPRGPQGDSAYEVAVDNGFVGTEQEWLDSIGGGGTVHIADFVFTAEEGQSIISLPGDRQMRIQSGEDSDLYLTAGDDLYIQTLGFGDDIWVQAADDIRFTAGRENDVEEGGRSYGWSMNSEGEFHLPENGYISNPYATVVTSGNRTATYTDSYLNDQSGIIDQNAVALSVDVDSTWFVDNLYSGIFTSPVVISFADGDNTTAVAIYDATSQGTPAVIFQWNDTIRTKTFAQTYPLNISVDYTTTTYDGTPTIVLDPADNNDDQVLVIEATAPNHIHLRAGGAIDQSTAELILGGERNKVTVSDTERFVGISTRQTRIENSYVNAYESDGPEMLVPESANIDEGTTVNVGGIEYAVTSFVADPQNTGYSIVTATGASFVSGASYTFTYEPGYNNQWSFDSDGVFSGPYMGSVVVPGLVGKQDSALYIQSPNNDIIVTAAGGSIILDGNASGTEVYVNDDTSEDNRVATLGDVPNLESVSSNIVPATDNLYSLGTPENRWSEVHIGPGTLYITDQTLLTEAAIAVNNGVFEIDGIVQAQLPNVRVTNLTFNDNTVQTTAYTGDASDPTEVVFAVAGGALGTQPTFTGAPLFSGSYVKTGPLVHFQIQVDMDNITNFGTGQYYVDLPFPAKYGYKFREGCLHDISANKDFEIGGHVYAGQSRLTLSSVDTQSGTVFDIPFTESNPTNLSTADNFHISGSYIIQEGV